MRSASANDRLISLLMAGSAILLVPSAGQGQVPCQYDVTIIQAPECPIFGFPPTFGRGLSEQGRIVGYHWDCNFKIDEPFVWSPETGLVTLNMPPDTYTSRGYGISADGTQSVGTAEIIGVGRHAFLMEGDTFIDLGTLPGGNFSEGLATDQGIVVGYWGNNVVGPIHGFIWQNALMTDLGPILGTSSSRAFDIAAGAVTGWMGSSTLSDAHAFILKDGLVKELPPIPGGFTSAGFAINSARDVAGTGLLVDPGAGQTVRHAFLFSNGRMTDLGVLPGMNWSRALDVNDMRTVVGASSLSNQNQTAFVWASGVMRALNDLIPFAVGLDVTSAQSINQTGQITGTATDQFGDVVAVLLTPRQPPLGDLDDDCQTGITDLLILLSEWGEANSPADLDGDGTVGILDLLILLSNWTA